MLIESLRTLLITFSVLSVLIKFVFIRKSVYIECLLFYHCMHAIYLYKILFNAAVLLSA